VERPRVPEARARHGRRGSADSEHRHRRRGARRGRRLSSIRRADAVELRRARCARRATGWRPTTSRPAPTTS
jgi:hypothetical protein